MALFKKKTTIVHNIAYMGLMTAINLLFIILATYIPFLMFLLIFLLPFVSTIVSFYCQKRYYIIYAIASIGLCLIFNIGDTIFYIIPAIITGFLNGLFLNKKISPFWLIFVASVIESIFTLAFIPLINLISGINIINTFLTIFKLNDFVYREELVFMFVYLMALVQSGLTNFVLLNDANKVGIKIEFKIASFAPYIIFSELTILLSLISSLFYAPIAYVFLLMSLYFSVFLLIDAITSKKIVTYILLAILFIVSFFIFVILYTKISEPYGLILLITFPISITIASFVNNYLLKKTANI